MGAVRKVPPQVNFLKHLYAAMLLHMDDTKVKLFWKKLPMVMSKQELTDIQKFEALWTGKTRISTEYFLRVLNSLEPFLIEEGLDVAQFIHGLFFGVYPGRYLSAKDLLYRLNDTLPDFFKGNDVRGVWLENLSCMHMEICPQSLHEVVVSKETKLKTTKLLMYSLDNPFNVPFDYEFWVKPWIENSPLLFDMPDFENIQLVGDARRVQDVLIGEWDTHNNDLMFDGSKVGKKIKYNDWAKKQGFSLVDFGLEDRLCWQMDQDVSCPRKKRVVLHKGTLYGAGESFLEIIYKKARNVPNPLSNLISSIPNDDEKYTQIISEKSTAFIHSLTQKINCIYHRDGESISINGKHFVRNVPAKILRKVMLQYTYDGRIEFENLEFKRDPEICLDTVNPNFEGRLNRLMANLEDKYPDMKLVRHRRGGFKLVLNCQVNFRTI